MNQIKLAIISNAGGVGKSTLAVNLAYDLAVRREHSVALIDLDPQRSLDVFCGLDPVDAEQSIASVLNSEFRGEWPLTNVWGNEKISVCQGHQTMEETSIALATHARGHFLLGRYMKKYPLPHQVVIMDCPATLGLIISNAISAATHLILPLQTEYKAVQGVADLIPWYLRKSEELDLDPSPELLGIVPSDYDKSSATHRDILEQLEGIAEQLEAKLYPAIRHSKELVNASGLGLPLRAYRPAHQANKDFQEIADDLSKLINAS